MKVKFILIAFVCIGLLTPTLAIAQEAIITGKVTDEAGEPLAGANVFIQLTTLGGAADINGTYRFEVPASTVRGQEVRLSARFIGYHTKTEKIVLTPGTITQDFTLAEDVLDMDAIIVTGVVDETPKTKMAFSVARVSSEMLEQVPATSPETALYGKVAGVKVVRGNGQPGRSASIQLRAPTSINARGRSQDPLYIVDGVIIDPSISRSPLTDIPAEDIESIEIVKGAAGASLYGSRASNGVIRISTRRGNHLALNQTRIRVRNEFGANSVTKTLKVNKHHAYKVADKSYMGVDAAGNPFQIEPGDFIAPGEDKVFGTADDVWLDPRKPQRTPDTYRDPNEVPHASGIEFYDNEYKYVSTGNITDSQGNFIPPKRLDKLFNQMGRFFDPGNYLSNSISISRNMEKTNFMVSFGHYQESGVVEGIDGLNRKNVRINLDHKIRRGLTLGITGLFSQSKRNLTNNTFGPFYAITFMAPDADLALIDTVDTQKLFIQPDPTSVEDNPLYFIRYNDRDDTRKRIMGSFSLRWAPVDWFNIEGNFSYDRSDRNNEMFWPIGYESISPGREISGRYVIGNAYDEALNGSLTASFARQFGDLVLRMKGRGLFERAEYKFAETDAADLAVREVRSLKIANPEATILDSNIEQVRSTGFSFITGMDFKDRYIADFLIRRDGSSLFGPKERWQTYFRASGAYRISQESWWFIPLFEEFKLRGSFGTAGGRPNFLARYETFSVSAGQVSKQNLGNKKLKPEFNKELEIGIDTAFLNRFTLDFSYAKSVVENQILFVPLPAYTGFGNQWRNAGTLNTHTFELTLNASILRSHDMNWTAGFTFDKTKQKITEFNVPPYRLGPFYFKNDEVLGAMYGDKWITDLNDLPAGIPRDQFNVNDDGMVVWVGEGHSYRDGLKDDLWGKSATLTDQYEVDHSYKWGIPIRYKKAVFDEQGEFKEYDEFIRLGDVVPDFNLGFNSTFRYKGITVYALFDAQIGGDIYNNTNQWGLRELKLAEVDQFGKPDELKKPGLYYATLYDINAVNSHFVEDGTYLKLRELRLSYTFDRKALSGFFGGVLNKLTIGFVGRNLLTFTGYKGYDPEVGIIYSELGSAALSRFDQFGYPNFRTLSGVVEFEF